MQQEIVFAVARFVRTCAGGQCHNGKQCQHNFFHVFSFYQKVWSNYTGPNSQMQVFISLRVRDVCADHTQLSHQNVRQIPEIPAPEMFLHCDADACFVYA